MNELSFFVEIDYENPTGRNGEKYYNFNTNEGDFCCV